MSEVTLLLRPDGVGVDVRAYEGHPSGRLLYAVLDVAAAAVRSGLPDPSGMYAAKTDLISADATTLSWQLGPWVMHAVDLRSIGLSTFFERVAHARMSNELSRRLLPSGLAFFSYGVTCEDDIAAGYLLQGIPDRLPGRVAFYLNAHAIAPTWLVGVFMALSHRGKTALFQEALGVACRHLEAHVDRGPFDSSELMGVLASMHLVGDEAEAILLQALVLADKAFDARVNALTGRVEALTGGFK